MNQNTEKSFTIKKSVRDGDPLVLIDFLEKHSKLSKSILKKVLNNGGVWVRKFATSKRVKTRRATFPLILESHIEFFYDPRYVNLEVPESKLILDFQDFGIWYKPPGVLSQGTDFGDHCSILRQVEKVKGKSFLVHRLDREAHGLMVLAYTQKGASQLSQMWSSSKVSKFYKVEVLGHLSLKYKNGGEINFKIDGKEARTTFKILEQKEFSTIALAQIHTGRLHQVRRHFDELGFPVLGDPKYGVGNKNEHGLKLLAFQLIFQNPFTHKEINVSCDDVIF